MKLKFLKYRTHKRFKIFNIEKKNIKNESKNTQSSKI